MTIIETLKDAAKKAEGASRDDLKILFYITLSGYIGMGSLIVLLSSSLRNRIAGFFTQAWFILSGFSALELVRGLAFWFIVNLALYVIIGITAQWRSIWESSKSALAEPGVDVPASKLKWFFEAILHGPAFGKEWIEDWFISDIVLAPKTANSATADRARAFQELCVVLDTYSDMETGTVSNRLTLLIYLLGALSVIFWGMYPFVRALKLNIVTTSETIMTKDKSFVQDIEKFKAAVRQFNAQQSQK